MSDAREPEGGEDELVPADDRIIGQASRWSALAVAGALAVAILVYWFARTEKKAEPFTEREAVPVVERAVSLEPPPVAFVDVTDAAGIRFRHVSGAEGEKLLPETMGGGCAFFDYDTDGDPDLLFVNSCYWPHSKRRAENPSMALYRNDGQARFTEVTAEAGLGLSFFGMGVACGDYDADGDPDLFLTAVGPNRLLRNDDGVFKDVTKDAGVRGDDSKWSSSAAFFDADQDGDLDLFVCNYVRWSREIDKQVDFQLTGVGRAYGPPMNFEATDSWLYRNESGRFTEVGEEAGIRVRNRATGTPVGKALAVLPIDVDADDALDLVVANDTVANFLFRNLGGGRFEEIGTRAGVAFDSDGRATGAMGIDAAWYRNDGALAIAIGNFANEMTSFYVSQAPGLFADEAITEGIGPASRLRLKFGVFFFDYDLDGRSDFLQANGHIEDQISVVQASQHYEQAAQLFWNRGGDGATYLPVDDTKVGDLSRPIVGRGAAYADMDADGDLDVVLTQIGGKPLLLRNEQALGNHWLRIRLRGPSPNPEAIGALVELTAGGVTQRRLVMPSRSYLSQVELPVTFGLGAATQIESLRIRWPDGRVEEVPVPGVDRELQIGANEG